MTTGSEAHIIGTFPNGDPWPQWAWDDFNLYGCVCFDEKNQRIDPLSVPSE
ncbi:MAG TPA: hypothetical protein PLB89_04870 [Flavobacteriales bacterium]|nr:hypothetical protein [Flavobacteriales bacterium]